MTLSVKTTKAHDGAAILHLTGSLVAGEGASRLREVVTSQPEICLVVDLEKVSAIDGSGLGILVWLRNWAVTSGRELTFTNPPARVRQLLELTHLDTVLPIANVEVARARRLQPHTERGVASNFCIAVG